MKTKTANEEEIYYPIRKALQKTGINLKPSAATIANWCRSGRLRSKKVHNRYYARVKDCNDFVNTYSGVVENDRAIYAS